MAYCVMCGMKSGDQPRMRCGLKLGCDSAIWPSVVLFCGIPLARTFELSGSQTAILVFGDFSLRIRATPVSVPPVPKPVTQ